MVDLRIIINKDEGAKKSVVGYSAWQDTPTRTHLRVDYNSTMPGMISKIGCLALAISSGLFGQQAQAQAVTKSQCASSVHAIIARGQGPGDDLNVMVKVQNMILNQIPGSTSVGLPYAHNADDKFTAVHDGALLMQNYVTEYLKVCPESKIALIGYSLV